MRMNDNPAQTHARLQPGDAAPPGTALDVDGQPVALEALWANGPTLLTFLRHYG
jgi:hypothetical protein